MGRENLQKYQIWFEWGKISYTTFSQTMRARIVRIIKETSWKYKLNTGKLKYTTYPLHTIVYIPN